MADSQHTTKPSAAPQEGPSQTTTGDPVVELSRELLHLWDADDAAQQEFSLQRKASGHARVDTQVEFGEWREAVETIISFSQAASLQGALVQIALTLDTIRAIFPALRDQKLEAGEREGELERRLRSAMRGIKQALHTELDPAVRSLLKIYGASDETHPMWIDQVEGWAEKGRVQRHHEGG